MGCRNPRRQISRRFVSTQDPSPTSSVESPRGCIKRDIVSSRPRIESNIDSFHGRSTLVTHLHARRTRRWLGQGLAAVVVGIVFQANVLQAQSPLTLPEPAASPLDGAKAGADNKSSASATDRTIHDPNVKKAQCCGGLLGPLFGGGGSCANGKSVPGRQNCSWCNYDTCWGRLIGGIYDCICCGDPCYEPRWLDEANAAFFQDGARPVTTTRIRWDNGIRYHFPDAAEFFWPKIGGKGPPKVENTVDYHELSFYQEVASGNFSMFVEMPYRRVEPDVNNSASNFGDVNVGTKTLLLDCELMQWAFQFRTYILSGNFHKGLGTGHVSLEPSLLDTFKLATNTYLQTQVAEWIPIAGDGDHAGAAMHYHFSINHALWRAGNNAAMIIGTFEVNGLTFQDGLFTTPAGTVESASGQSIVQIGPGIRFSLCSKLDIGMGAGFGITDHGPDQLYRFEFRYRY